MIVFEGNSYIDSLIGAKRAVVQIEGFPNVWSISEKYVRNENWFSILYDTRSVLLSIDPNDTAVARESKLINATLKIDQSFLRNYASKSESVLTIWRPAKLLIDGTKFESNFVVDDIFPFSTSVDSIA